MEPEEVQILAAWATVISIPLNLAAIIFAVIAIKKTNKSIEIASRSIDYARDSLSTAHLGLFLDKLGTPEVLTVRTHLVEWRGNLSHLIELHK